MIPGVEFPSLFVEGCVWFLASILLGLVDLLYRSRVCRRGSDGPTVLGKESYGLTPDGGQSVPGRGERQAPARQLREETQA